jgi:hypothetical protein
VPVSAAVLAELLRGGPRDAQVNAVLNQGALEIVDVGRGIARIAGGLLGASGLASSTAIDAFVAATPVRAGGVIATSDPSDLRRLASSHRNVKVVPL